MTITHVVRSMAAKALLPTCAIVLSGCFNALDLPKLDTMLSDQAERQYIEEQAKNTQSTDNPLANDGKDHGYNNFIAKRQADQNAGIAGGGDQNAAANKKPYIDYMLMLDPSEDSDGWFSTAVKNRHFNKTTKKKDGWYIGNSVGVAQTTFSDAGTTVGGVYKLNGLRTFRKDESDRGIDNIYIKGIGHWRHFTEKPIPKEVDWKTGKAKYFEIPKDPAKRYIYENTYGRMFKHMGDVFEQTFGRRDVTDEINEHTKVWVMDGFDLPQLGNFTGLLLPTGMKQILAGIGINKHVNIEGDFNWFNGRANAIAQEIFEWKKKDPKNVVFLYSMSSSTFKALSISHRLDELIKADEERQKKQAAVAALQPATPKTDTATQTAALRALKPQKPAKPPVPPAAPVPAAPAVPPAESAAAAPAQQPPTSSLEAEKAVVADITKQVENAPSKGACPTSCPKPNEYPWTE